MVFYSFLFFPFIGRGNTVLLMALQQFERNRPSYCCIVISSTNQSTVPMVIRIYLPFLELTAAKINSNESQETRARVKLVILVIKEEDWSWEKI